MTDFMNGFSEPEYEAGVQWAIWDNYKAHEALWGGMEHDPHDHCDALYDIPYVRAGLETYQWIVPKDAGSVLEIGCAQGYILNYVGGPDTRRTGVDFNEDRIRKGRQQYPDTEFIVGDIVKMRLKARAYDYVLLPGVLEHVRYQDARVLIERAMGACKIGGFVVFDLPFWSGQPGDFNDGIHKNPSHAWTCTPHRWDWLLRGLDVERTYLQDVPFYVMGVISVPEPQKVLVGCWGKIGDILHAMPLAQSIEMGNVSVVYAQDFAAAGGVIDLLKDIDYHFPAAYNYGADDLGVKGWDRVINCSHVNWRTDPVNKWNIFGWWDNGFHGIDYAAAFAHTSLRGEDRYLHFKPDVKQEMTDTVVFLSNCGDPGMRGVPHDYFVPIEAAVRELGGNPVEVSMGPICTGKDRRGVELGEVVRLMAESRAIVSLDTMASALLAQSLGIPIVRIHRGATRPSATGPTDPAWTGARSLTDSGHGAPAKQDDVIKYIRNLWNWRIVNGTDKPNAS